ncbi:MAG: hypothetical protein WBA12_02625 [Catalinimonas sp.]
MTDQELQTLWRAAAPPPAQLEPPQLVRRLKDEYAKLNRTLLYRDLREYVAGLCVVITFSYTAYHADRWPVWLGCGAVIVACVYACFHLYLGQRHRPAEDPAGPTRTYLRQMRAYVRHQQRMLEEVDQWYVRPFLIGLGLFAVGLIAGTYLEMVGQEPVPWTWQLGLAGLILFFLGVPFVLIGYFMRIFLLKINRDAARTFNPILASIDTTLSTLELEPGATYTSLG